MKKILSLALILMLALASFTGAVAQEDRGEPNVTVDSVYYDDWSIEITWLPQDGFDTTDTAMADYLVGTAVAFVKDHPEVKVTCAAQSINIADAMSKLLTQAAAGNAPDVAPWTASICRCITTISSPSPMSSRPTACPWTAGSPLPGRHDHEDGDIVAMWYDTDVRALYYQKSVMPTPPATWDELFAMMEPLKEEGYMFLYPAGANETTSCDVWPWFWSLGGQILDEEGNPVFAEGSNYDALIKTFDFLKQTIDTGITPTRVTSFMTDTDVNTDVMTGKVACFVGGQLGRHPAGLADGR